MKAIEQTNFSKGMRKVLIVEDDQAMAVALRDGFTYEGFNVQVARDGEAGFRFASENNVDLVILDVMLPRMSGMDVCKKLRAGGNTTPIIMLTARGQEIDKVLGLKTGADDYVTKPFSFLELMARVEAVLRRFDRPRDTVESVSFGNVSVNFKRMEATKSGELMDLSPREFRLLQYFIERRGEVISRDELLDHVWGYDDVPLSRTVDMHIAKLRQKIEDTPSDPRHIITVHRVGYKFVS